MKRTPWPGCGAAAMPGHDGRNGGKSKQIPVPISLTPDRSLLPARAGRLSHAALSQEAACLEHDGCWGAAAAYWEAAAMKVSGREFAWCQARMAWCLRRALDALRATEEDVIPCRDRIER